MSGKKIEIKQIAEALSLSSTTVSRALSGKGRVSQETKKKIIAYIEAQKAVPAVHCAKYTDKKTKNILVTVAGESKFETKR